MSKPALGNSAIPCDAAFNRVLVANVDHPQLDRELPMPPIAWRPTVPLPAGSKGSSRTAAWMVAGAISLSNSNHFGGTLY